MEVELQDAIQSAMTATDACIEVRKIYTRLQLEIDRRKPICVASGKCCNFDSYGHRLYVTTLELATFKLDFDSVRIIRHELPILQGGCPLQAGRLCSVHAIRPFGCRIFFCDPSATQWQQEQYELFHRELKQLHDQFNIPYFYVEWRQGLSTLGIS